MVGNDMDGMGVVDRHDFVDVRTETEKLAIAAPGNEQLDGDEGDVVDHDAPDLGRRDQPEIAGLVAFEKRCEKANEFFAGDERAVIIPFPVTIDADVEIATEVAVTGGCGLDIAECIRR